MKTRTTAAVPRFCWALLDRLGHRDDHANADAGTVASSKTSAGKNISVSLRLAAPPATSRLYLSWSGGPTKNDPSFVYPRIVAAHGDSVLFQLATPSPPKHPRVIDYFVYRAGGAARRPPSLSLLKQYPTTPFSPRQRMVDWKAIGILRRGEDAYAVAELSATGDLPVAFELCVICSPWKPADKWKVRWVEVIDEKARNPELSSWENDAVVPVGDRFLCWVDYHTGILLGDVFDARSALRFEQLPRQPVEPRRASPEASRRVCASPDDGGTVRFVSIDGDLWPGIFTVTIWTMRNSRDGKMEWHKDVGFNAAELWAFSGYEPLPRVPPEYPVLSMDDPDALCFLVSQGRHTGGNDDTVWLVEVDTKRRAVLSVARYGKEETRRKRKRESMPVRPAGYYQEGTQRMSSWYAPSKEEEDDVNITSTQVFHGHAFLPCSKIVFR